MDEFTTRRRWSLQRPLYSSLGGPAVRILIANDHEMLRNGVRRTLEEREDWQVCVENREGREAVELAKKLMPNVSFSILTVPERSPMHVAMFGFLSLLELETHANALVFLIAKMVYELLV